MIWAGAILVFMKHEFTRDQIISAVRVNKCPVCWKQCWQVSKCNCSFGKMVQLSMIEDVLEELIKEGKVERVDKDKFRAI